MLAAQGTLVTLVSEVTAADCSSKGPDDFKPRPATLKSEEPRTTALFLRDLAAPDIAHLQDGKGDRLSIQLQPDGWRGWDFLNSQHITAVFRSDVTLCWSLPWARFDCQTVIWDCLGPSQCRIWALLSEAEEHSLQLALGSYFQPCQHSCMLPRTRRHPARLAATPPSCQHWCNAPAAPDGELAGYNLVRHHSISTLTAGTVPAPCFPCCTHSLRSSAYAPTLTYVSSVHCCQNHRMPSKEDRKEGDTTHITHWVWPSCLKHNVVPTRWYPLG